MLRKTKLFRALVDKNDVESLVSGCVSSYQSHIGANPPEDDCSILGISLESSMKQKLVS